MEGMPATQWNSIADLYATTYGISLAYIGVFNNIGANIASYASGLGARLYAAGNWGSGTDPNLIGSVKSTVTTNGCLYHAPWWWQDVRPKSKVFDENLGTKAHRTYADRIIADQPAIIQLGTWSDYSEGSAFHHSASQGRALLDLTAYEISRIRRGGAEPTILTDTVFLAHRSCTAATVPVSSPAGAQTSGFMVQWVGSGRPASGQSPLTYEVEVITFLKAASDTNGVIVTVGGVQYTFTAPAGRSTFRVPLVVNDAPAVVVKRSGVTVASLASPITVRSTTWQQNMEQFVMGSNRPVEQFDPTQTATGATPVYPVV